MSDATALLVAIPMAAIFAVLGWFIYRVLLRLDRACQIDEALYAYKLKRFRTEIEKKHINFKQMMEEYYDSLEFYKKNRRKTPKQVLDDIDGEISEKTEKKEGGK